MAIHEQEPHFVLLPFMAQGHLIPMVDIARLLARRNVTITILTTPHNGNRVKTVIDRAIASGLAIRVHHLDLPCAQVELSEGIENYDMLSSQDDALKFFKAMLLLKNQVQELLQQLKPSPCCLIADMCFPWATDVALSLHIPRILFHGLSCFSLLCWHVLRTSKDFEDVASDDTKYFVLPGLPDRIEITKAQIPGLINQTSSDWNDIRLQMRDSEVKAFGTVVNTFEELEPEYVKGYKKVKEGKKVWCVGPVSLCNKDDLDKTERGNKASVDKHECLRWLDSKEPSSVIYACLGSIASLSTSQLVELGLALEASNHPFVWVIKNASKELETWLRDEKFEERIGGKGLLIRGWAPQVLILSHWSVGGFLTHCGWNSTLEGITAGLPMVTWPVMAEQFCNEKFIVSVIKTGIRVGVELAIILGEEEKVGVQVNRDEIKRAIYDLMDGGEQGEERRGRARELSEMAKRAPEEGGSSYNNMALLIQDVMLQKDNYGNECANAATLDRDNPAEVIAQ